MPLITGIGASLETWDPFERALVGRGVQTVAFDLPGTGESPPISPPRRMRGIAGLAGAVLDGLGLAAGTCWVCASAGEWRSNWPARRRDVSAGLVLAATAPCPGCTGFRTRPSSSPVTTTPSCR